MTDHPDHGLGLQDNPGLLHRISARLAGSMPAAELDPAVVTAMEEMGLDLSHGTSHGSAAD